MSTKRRGAEDSPHRILHGIFLPAIRFVDRLRARKPIALASFFDVPRRKYPGAPNLFPELPSRLSAIIHSEDFHQRHTRLYTRRAAQGAKR
jgi:hypothetical protein